MTPLLGYRPSIVNQNKMVFQNGYGERRRNVQQELKKTLRQAMVEYKKKVERQLENNNTKEVWRGMRTITGYRPTTTAASPAQL